MNILAGNSEDFIHGTVPYCCTCITLVIFIGDEKQNGPVKMRVTCQCMLKRPFSLDEMQLRLLAAGGRLLTGIQSNESVPFTMNP